MIWASQGPYLAIERDELHCYQALAQLSASWLVSLLSVPAQDGDVGDKRVT
jgi:hypothetical protein